MTEREPQVLLHHYLKKLKLPTMLREYGAVASSCAQDNFDYVSFLLRLVEREALDREKRSAERRVKNARFPVILGQRSGLRGVHAKPQGPVLYGQGPGEPSDRDDRAEAVGTHLAPTGVSGRVDPG